ncbi:hypothetical protein [Sphingopyxis macrogoltabida]|uniref:Uncharacterized protein n=1 Tax=Sphingopyxis macrogoltabida TaxID=33050 RepID=A0AAC8YZL8_SPHMC|nr:hypothetical protein [Sphingopyxis macrogoltabida]ALJ13720.1 hypothetical protein LH19_12640 [Sphingopyxis macrogoltabida]AMU88837.1 hypothetical protein ATM17_07250 [Sphingopyxis macrogoltabida]
MSELVREIVEVNAAISGDEENPVLTVEVEGLAPTAGWTAVRLDPHVYITPPEDGFQDFDLVGDRPSDAAADALTEVEAAWEGPLADWCIGVRVHAVDNMFEEEVYEPWDEEDDVAQDEAA